MREIYREERIIVKMIRDQLYKSEIRRKKLKNVRKTRVDIQEAQQRTPKGGRKKESDAKAIREEMEKDELSTTHYDEVEIMNERKEKEFLIETLTQIRDERLNKTQKKTVSVAHKFDSNNLHDTGEFEPRKWCWLNGVNSGGGKQHGENKPRSTQYPVENYKDIGKGQTKSEMVGKRPYFDLAEELAFEGLLKQDEEEKRRMETEKLAQSSREGSAGKRHDEKSEEDTR